MSQVQSTKQALEHRTQMIQDRERQLELERKTFQDKIDKVEREAQCKILIAEMIQIVELQEVQNKVKANFEQELRDQQL